MKENMLNYNSKYRQEKYPVVWRASVNTVPTGSREQVVWCADGCLWQWPLFFRASTLALLAEFTSLSWRRRKQTLFQQNRCYRHYMIKIPKDPSRGILLYWKITQKQLGRGGRSSIPRPDSRYFPKRLNFLYRTKKRKKTETKKKKKKTGRWKKKEHWEWKKKSYKHMWWKRVKNQKPNFTRGPKIHTSRSLEIPQKENYLIKHPLFSLECQPTSDIPGAQTRVICI